MNRVLSQQKHSGLRRRAPGLVQRVAARAIPAPSPRHGFAAISPRFGLAEARRRPADERRRGLPEPLKTNIEAMSGLAMDDVRVHRDSARPAALDAYAFTQGSDIHLAPGEDQHLPHEAWHVVQQKQGRVAATTQLKGVGINADHKLELEADSMGARAASARFGPGIPRARETGPAGCVVQRAALSASRCTVRLGNDFRNNHLATSTQDAKDISVARARSLGQQTMINTVINSSEDDFRATVAASEFNDWANGAGGRRYQALSLDHWSVSVARGGNDNYTAGSSCPQSTGAVSLGAYFNYWSARRGRWGYNVVVSKIGSG